MGNGIRVREQREMLRIQERYKGEEREEKGRRDP